VGEQWKHPGESLLRRNRNRGYQQLRVWEEAIELYKIVSEVFASFPFVLAKVASENIASADSVHRNIAEGYCRRTIKEYLQHLNIALGSLGETVSGASACRTANQISTADFDRIDGAAFKLENGMLKLVASLEFKRDTGSWTETLIVRESNAAYSSGVSGPNTEETDNTKG
jgi:four helix bundle protein